MIFSFTRYFGDGGAEFAGVVYRADQVVEPGRERGSGDHHCHSHHLHLEARERWRDQTAARHNHSHNHSHTTSHSHSHSQNLFESLPNSPQFQDGVLRVKEPSITATSPHNRRKSLWKSKRASGDYYDKRKTTCMLYLQADHLFWEQMGRSEEACIEVMTRHVQRVNSIYRAVGEHKQEYLNLVNCTYFVQISTWTGSRTTSAS